MTRPTRSRFPLTLIAILIVLSLALSACSAARSESPQMDADKGGMSYNEAPAAEPEMSEDYYSEEAPREANGSGSGGDSAQPERIVIKNANLSIAVPDPLATLDMVTNMADEMGGFVVSSNTYKTSLSDGTEVPQASITIRVPAERLKEAMDQIKSQVSDQGKNVLSETVSGQDVTSEYRDLQSRLKNLQEAEQELTRIMEETNRAEDVLNVFNQLTYIREQIEVLQGQIKYYDEASALSAISVDIKAEAAVAPLTVAGWEPVGVARDAVQALINTLQFLVNALIWIILYVLPVVLVIFLPLRLLWWVLRRNRKPRQPQQPQAPTAVPPSQS